MHTPSDRGLFRPSLSAALGRMARSTSLLTQAALIGLVILANCAALVARAPRAVTSVTASGAADTAPVAVGGTPITARTATPGDVRPVQVAVPRVGIRSGVIKLGTAPDGTLEVPEDFDLTGWYAAGPPPGERGAAVVVGHVDSYTGPAVFYRLREVRRGDRIDVRRADGSVVQFTVEQARSFAKDDFPTELVYRQTDNSTLRLVTCGGPFDRKTKSYLENFVVFARASRLVPPPAPAPAPAKPAAPPVPAG